MLGLVEAPEADERVGEAEVTGDDVEGVAGQLGGGDGAVGGDPGGVGFILAGEGDGDGLVGASSHGVELAALAVLAGDAHRVFELRDEFS